MCGRYTFTPHKSILPDERRLLPADFQFDIFEHFNIAPTMTVPVLTAVQKIEMMQWWLIPGYEKEFKVGKYSMFNKKSEELEKPYWQRLLKNNRCVLPMTSFYEWKKVDKKTKIPYLIYPSASAFFWAAGLYDHWTDKETGEAKGSFTILTMPPNEMMAEIHDRMPVFIQPADVPGWLADVHPKDLLRSFPAQLMCKHRVGTAVGNSRNNYPELLAPVPDVPGTLF